MQFFGFNVRLYFGVGHCAYFKCLEGITLRTYWFHNHYKLFTAYLYWCTYLFQDSPFSPIHGHMEHVVVFNLELSPGNVAF